MITITLAQVGKDMFFANVDDGSISTQTVGDKEEIRKHIEMFALRRLSLEVNKCDK